MTGALSLFTFSSWSRSLQRGRMGSSNVATGGHQYHYHYHHHYWLVIIITDCWRWMVTVWSVSPTVTPWPCSSRPAPGWCWRSSAGWAPSSRTTRWSRCLKLTSPVLLYQFHSVDKSSPFIIISQKPWGLRRQRLQNCNLVVTKYNKLSFE